MTVTELITQLEQIKEQYGDISVAVCDTCSEDSWVAYRRPESWFGINALSIVEDRASDGDFACVIH